MDNLWVSRVEGGSERFSTQWAPIEGGYSHWGERSINKSHFLCSHTVHTNFWVNGETWRILSTIAIPYSWVAWVSRFAFSCSASERGVMALFSLATCTFSPSLPTWPGNKATNKVSHLTLTSACSFWPKIWPSGIVLEVGHAIYFCRQ